MKAAEKVMKKRQATEGASFFLKRRERAAPEPAKGMRDSAMFLMKPEAIDRQIRHSRLYMLAGASLIATAFLLRKAGVGSLGLALITPGVMAVMLGAMGGACHTWRTEKGIWMLSALFFFPSLAFYIIFEIYQWMSMDSAFSTLHGAVFTVDSFVATWLLLKQARFLASVTLYNRRLSRQMSDESKNGL